MKSKKKTFALNGRQRSFLCLLLMERMFEMKRWKLEKPSNAEDADRSIAFCEKIIDILTKEE